jgi:hypothetical protein
VKRQIVCAVLLLAACHDQRPPAPTAQESAQLNEMDNALNAMGNGTGPEANASGKASSSAP